MEQLKFLKPLWGRMISLDLETKVLDRREMLTNEMILSVNIARRTSGELTHAGIEVETIILSREDEESEKELLENLNEKLGEIKPLGVVGYAMRGYDIPLLLIKKQRYYQKYVSPLWKLIDTLESAVHVDLQSPLKRIGCRKLEDAIYSPIFGNLPLKKTKSLFPSAGEDKAKAIYEAWKTDREKFKKYAEGDAHDTLLIAEKMLVDSGKITRS